MRVEAAGAWWCATARPVPRSASSTVRATTTGRFPRASSTPARASRRRRCGRSRRRPACAARSSPSLPSTEYRDNKDRRQDRALLADGGRRGTRLRPQRRGGRAGWLPMGEAAELLTYERDADVVAGLPVAPDRRSDRWLGRAPARTSAAPGRPTGRASSSCRHTCSRRPSPVRRARDLGGEWAGRRRRGTEGWISPAGP